MSENSIRILIVDDHAVVRQSLRQVLEAQAGIQVLSEAADGEMAVRLARTLLPDVILLDLLMPGMNGVQVIQKIALHRLPCKVLALTSSLDDHMIREALRAGASGYMLKSSRVADVVQAIRRVAGGEMALDPAVTQAIVKRAHTHDPLETLTLREREVFDQMAKGRNNAEIAEALHISEITVRTHIAAILDKLSLRDRTQVVIYALKRGLVRVEELP